MAVSKDSTIVAGLKKLQREKLTRDEMIHVTAVIAMLDTGGDEVKETPEKVEKAPKKTEESPKK